MTCPRCGCKDFSKYKEAFHNKSDGKDYLLCNCSNCLNIWFTSKEDTRLQFQNWLSYCSPIVKKSYEIASEAHTNDHRWNGDPYITHIERVMLNAENLHSQFIHNGEVSLDKVLCLAALHDVVEDHPAEYSFVSIEHSLQRISPILITVNLAAITKDKSKNYLDYIRGILSYLPAVLVKLADLKDNLSDLKDGSMKDKYLLSQYILTEELKRATK